jgi:hypothetical protein
MAARLIFAIRDDRKEKAGIAGLFRETDAVAYFFLLPPARL